MATESIQEALDGNNFWKEVAKTVSSGLLLPNDDCFSAIQKLDKRVQEIMDEAERNTSITDSLRLELIDLIQRKSDEKSPLYICTKAEH